VERVTRVNEEGAWECEVVDQPGVKREAREEEDEGREERRGEPGDDDEVRANEGCRPGRVEGGARRGGRGLACTAGGLATGTECWLDWDEDDDGEKEESERDRAVGTDATTTRRSFLSLHLNSTASEHHTCSNHHRQPRPSAHHAPSTNPSRPAPQPLVRPDDEPRSLTLHHTARLL